MKTLTTVLTLGNGQLGLMLDKAAKKLGIPFSALSLTDAWAWLKSDHPTKDILITFEQEHVDEALVGILEAKGFQSFPSWKSFRLLRSKRSQKEFLLKNQIPTSPYLAVSEWSDSAQSFLAQNKGGILKAGKGGYDGKGVWSLDAEGYTRRREKAPEIAANIQEPYLEARVNFDFEIAAVVCRSQKGEIEVYPTVKSVQLDGICFQVEYTKEFAQTSLALRAGEIAKTIAEKLDYIGVLAVECFVKGDEVLVNEIAPRVHNSGHFTIDLCAGSQFENHLRAGLGLPLERTEPTHPAALMVNLLWPPEEKEFAPLYTKLTCGPYWPENVKLHWYGKSEPRPRRKMGHFTVYDQSLEECKSLADQILASRWA